MSNLQCKRTHLNNHTYKSYYHANTCFILITKLSVNWYCTLFLSKQMVITAVSLSSTSLSTFTLTGTCSVSLLFLICTVPVISSDHLIVMAGNNKDGLHFSFISDRILYKFAVGIVNFKAINAVLGYININHVSFFKI